MKKLLVLAIVVAASVLARASQSMCVSTITKELEACARENFQYSDKVLNSAYADLAAKLPAADKGVLVRAEKEWRVYKETTCRGAYDATAPGNEAGIDKWTCLDQITRSRIEELRYLNAGIGALGFYKALGVVSEFYEGGSQEKFVSKLTEVFTKSNDQNWRSFVEDNCRLAAVRLHEENSQCVARQVFYRY